MDKGHDKLISDLSMLLLEAQQYEFHDFRNQRYATPKVELVRQLNQLADNVKNGDYDN